MSLRFALGVLAAGAVLAGCADRSSVGTEGRAPAIDSVNILDHAITTRPAESFGDGTYEVLVDVAAGTYRTTGPASPTRSCYWARLADSSGEFTAIVTNGIAEGPAVVTIAPTDRAFESHGCARWQLAR